jgi:hypothetical protein
VPHAVVGVLPAAFRFPRKDDLGPLARLVRRIGHRPKRHRPPPGQRAEDDHQADPEDEVLEHLTGKVGGDSSRAGDEQLCSLLGCLLTPESLGRFQLDHQIDVEAVRSCIERWCRERVAPLSGAAAATA